MTLPANIDEELHALYLERGFGGLMVAPSAPVAHAIFEGTSLPSMPVLQRPLGLQYKNPPDASPWIPLAAKGEAGIGSYVLGIGGTFGAPPKTGAGVPAYLSKEYFDRLREVLEYSKRNNRKVIFYDEAGFPSGVANHTTPEKYYRKLLEKSEEHVTGPGEYKKDVPADGRLMAIVAVNRAARKRIDLTPMVKDGALAWHVPAGQWNIQTFRCITSKAVGGIVDYNVAADYMDPEAVQWFIDRVYEPHFREVGSYFGNTIFMSFFDDVGIFSQERTWAVKFNEKFRERLGRDPAIYYPALWEDIGPETEPARIAFFETRAEMLADGFPRLISEWGAAHGLPVSGHCPGNYEVQPLDMNGDPFKFYRAQPVPMIDVIFGRGFGRDGYKLISSAADLNDKPVVAAETFNTTGTSLGYGKMMELFARGITRFVTGANTVKDIGGPAEFAKWAGRASMLLQGGRRVSEIAIFYPIAALEAFYYFDAPANSTIRAGTFVPPETDYLAVGEMLVDQVHRDFTFLHPDTLTSDRVRVEGGTLRLANQVNWQGFRVLILPGEKVISLKALEKIKQFYDGGGAVIATSLLPSRAAELAGIDEMRANDERVEQIMNAMFGPGGKGIFIPRPDAALLSQALDKLGIAPDVAFAENPQPASGNGFFSYIHKTKEGKEIYYFANSSADAVDTRAELRGKLKPEVWDPTTGAIKPAAEVQYLQKGGVTYTVLPLKLNAVSSEFLVATR